MKRISLLSLVISNLLFLSVGFAATRPHYGGTLRITTRSSPSSLDPLQESDSLTENNLTQLIFDTLTKTNDRGTLQPCLATSWAAEPGNQRWQIRLRPDVTFADGSPLSTDVVSSSLRASNPKWKIFPNVDSIIIETDIPNPQLPDQLALPRNAIVKRSGGLLGTGPFTVAQWQPGKSLILTAKENYWGSRPFIDSIQISLGQNQREQMISLDLSKADVVEIAPEQSHRLGMESYRVSTTQPVELLALVFAGEAQSSDEEALRRALALSIDRSSINNVLLQGTAVPAGSLLPDWMSGYSFLFPSEYNVTQARHLRSQSRQAVTWTLGYDISDSLARVIADRIALNSRDAGITVQVSSSNSTDIRLSRARIDSLDPRLALLREARALGLPESPAMSGNSPEDLFSAESSLLRSERVIPLLHVRVAYALSSFIKNWNAGPDGAWCLEDAWIGADRN
jgi:peptide/nickel transport system substrate-binding protein